MKKIDIFPEALFNGLLDIPMFAQIEPTDLDDLPNICSLYSFEPDETIIHEGETNSCLYTLLSGKVNIIKKGKHKEEIIINHLETGSIFGETSIFQNEPSTATVRAKKLCLIMVLTRENFTNYIHKHPKAGLIMLTYIIFGLLEKLRTSNEVIAFDKEFLVSSDDLEVMKKMFPPNLEDMLI